MLLLVESPNHRKTRIKMPRTLTNASLRWECASQSNSPVLESLRDHGTCCRSKLKLFRVPSR